MSEAKARPKALILVYFLFLLITFYLFSWFQSTVFSLFTDLSPSSLLIMSTVYIMAIALVYLGLRLGFGTRLYHKPRLRLLIPSFLVFFSVLSILSLFKDLQSSADRTSLSWILSSLFFTSLQVLFEESLFRMALGYIEAPVLPERKLLYSLLSGFLFTVAHMSNPQAIDPRSLFFYFSMGFVLMYLSLYTGGFEIAYAIHLANNLFVDFIVGYNTPMNKRPLFIQTDPTDHLVLDTIISLGVISIMTILMEKRRKSEKKKN